MKYLSIYLILLIMACAEKKNEPQQITKAEDNRVLFKSEDFTDSLFSIGIEGPYFHKGYLYAVNVKERGNIARVHNDGSVELFRQLPEGSVGNGIRFNSEGKMLIADYKKHIVWMMDIETKELKIFAQNNKMNQPNDLTISKQGFLFAADPDWATSTGNLWRINTDGSTYLLESKMGTANGVELSPDSKKLYVNESVQRNVWVYEVDPSGNISNKKLLIKFDDYGMDGMRTDKEGNLYIARYGKGTIAVVTPEGKLKREIDLKGKTPTNLTFGGEDGKTIFVTMQDRRRIECFYNDIAGSEF